MSVYSSIVSDFLENTPPIAVLPVNQILLSYYSTTPSASYQTISSETSHCTCFISLDIALQTQQDGHLFIDFYNTPSDLLYTEDITISGSPIVATYRRNITDKYVKVRLVLDNPPIPGALGIFATLRKQYA